MASEGSSHSRAKATYEPRFERFILNTKNYVRQYNQIYILRLQQMREHLEKRVATRWGSIALLERIIDIEAFAEHVEEISLVGMIVKDLCLRKSVLDDYRDGERGSHSASFQPLTALASDVSVANLTLK